MKFLQFLLRYMKPVFGTEDEKRQGFILNVLLLAAITLLVIAIMSSVMDALFSSSVAQGNDEISRIALAILLSGVVGLYSLSRKGLAYIASYILIGVFFTLSVYMSGYWGVDLPTAILLDALIIVMAGILISTRFAFLVTSVLSCTMLVLGYLQQHDFIHVNSFWRTETWTQGDTIVTTIIFLIIATVSWLSNREIEKSLMRARKSEAELRVERDMLEIRVEERTRELKEAQVEKMAQLYRFAEFGRLSSGLFHDLINPLTAVSLNMEQVRAHHKSDELGTAQAYMDRAIMAARKMEMFILSIRKQLAREENVARFSASEEVQQVADVLAHKAMREGVRIEVSCPKEVEMFGDAVKLNQVALNLIANAIDAYEGVEREPGDESCRTIVVSLTENGDMVCLSVADRGAGITDAVRAKLFDPFFTTKGVGKGMGIGLSTTRRIVEKELHGTIDVVSEPGQGAIFTVRFPRETSAAG